MKLIYDVQDRPPIKETIIFAFQQMIAIMAATLLVPMLMTGFTGGAVYFDPAAALCGAEGSSSAGKPGGGDLPGFRHIYQICIQGVSR